MWPAVLWWRFLNFLLGASCVWTLLSRGLQSYRRLRSRSATNLLLLTRFDVWINHQPSLKIHRTDVNMSRGERKKGTVNATPLRYYHVNVLAVYRDTHLLKG